MSIGSDLGAPSKYLGNQTVETGQYMVRFVCWGLGHGREDNRLWSHTSLYAHLTSPTGCFIDISSLNGKKGTPEFLLSPDPTLPNLASPRVAFPFSMNNTTIHSDIQVKWKWRAPLFLFSPTPTSSSGHYLILQPFLSPLPYKQHLNLSNFAGVNHCASCEVLPSLLTGPLLAPNFLLHPVARLIFLKNKWCFLPPLLKTPGLRGAAAVRRYSMSQVSGGGCEEILHIQGKEQQLHFAGTAMKKYSMSKVRKIPVRQSVWREGIRRQTDWNHNHIKLTNLIIWATAFSTQWNYTMPCRATQEGRVMVERSDKMWSTGEGNGKPLHCSCLGSPKNHMTRQKR